MGGIKFQKEVEEGKLSNFPRHIKFLDFCLKGSEKFADRKIISGKYEKCVENDYDISKLKDFFGFKENEPIVRTNAWDKLKSKIKKNNLQLLAAADLKNKTYSQYATSSNPDEIVHLSKIARASLELDNDFVLTKDILEAVCEELLEDAKKLSEEKAIIINATEKDAEVLKDYIDSGIIMLKVKGERLIYDKDYINYVQSEDNSASLIDITMDQIQKFGDREELRGKDFCLIIQQEEFDKLSDKEVKEIFKKYNIALCIYRMNDILNVDTQRLAQYDDNMAIYYKDADYPEYGAETVEEEKDQVRSLIYDVKDTDSELEKFIKVYTKLMENITYALDLDPIFDKQDREEELTEEEDDLLVESQNLTGVLTRNYYMWRIFKNITVRIR